MQNLKFNKSKKAFSNFCKKVRICLLHYLTFEYLCKNMKLIVKKVKKRSPKTLYLQKTNPTIKRKLPTHRQIEQDYMKI